jgi:hypothetical protein
MKKKIEAYFKKIKKYQKIKKIIKFFFYIKLKFINKVNVSFK